MLCIALPIPIIVNNFNKFYEKSKIEEEIASKKARASWEVAKKGETVRTMNIFLDFRKSNVNCEYYRTFH